MARVCHSVINHNVVLYEVRWLDTMFQKHTQFVSIGALQCGIENYRALTRTESNPSWHTLTSVPDNEILPPDAVLEDLAEDEGVPVEFDSDQLFPTSLKEVEALKSMKFDPRVAMNAPEDLYTHRDGSTMTRVRPECTYPFTLSAASSFLACIPLYFWWQMVNKTMHTQL
ncbi:hypothetical protein JG687_00005215 [Phytophthora cactorum]|uniref:Uncharacterized protein n=1 Tax=Phytophthora cactorum TaxID=29920 RepID=A0A8T1ULK4_9STRA|nr:hypothetical protein JG687_00005215 [Phytophthora cactorum]